MPFTTTTPTPVYYEVAQPEAQNGSFETLIFAHGAGGNAGIWFNQLAHFGQNYRAIAFDHPGFGRSPLPGNPRRVQRFRDDLLAIMDEQDIERAHLVGQSMGGFTVLRTTLDAPDRVRSLTLSATSGGIHNPEPPTDAARELTTSDGRGTAAIKATMSAATKNKPAMMQLYESINNFNINFSWSNLSTLLNADDVVQWEELANIKVRAQIITGAEDPLFPSSTLAGFVPHFADGHIEVVADAGHSPYFERPEEFNRILAAHIAAA